MKILHAVSLLLLLAPVFAGPDPQGLQGQALPGCGSTCPARRSSPAGFRLSSTISAAKASRTTTPTRSTTAAASSTTPKATAKRACSTYICHFRENEGVDISYVKKLADLNHPSMVFPEWQQLYLGWEETGEWVNYTVDVKKAGRYKIVAMYSHTANTMQFSLNNQPAADCKLPVDPWTQFPDRHDPDWMMYHAWNRAECGEIEFPKAGHQLLTLHYKTGNNLAYFDFIPVELG